MVAVLVEHQLVGIPLHAACILAPAENGKLKIGVADHERIAWLSKKYVVPSRELFVPNRKVEWNICSDLMVLRLQAGCAPGREND